MTNVSNQGRCGCNHAFDGQSRAKTDEAKFNTAFDGAAGAQNKQFLEGLRALGEMLKNIIQLLQQLQNQGGQDCHKPANAQNDGHDQISHHHQVALNIDVDLQLDIDIRVEKPDVKPEFEGKLEVNNGRVWGDPHFVGADGGKYDVQGEHGKIYNILSDKGVQLNAEFMKWGDHGATVVKNYGLTVGDNTVQIGPKGQLVIDGDQAIVHDGTYANGHVIKEGDKITVKAGEYTLVFSDTHKGYVNNLDIRSNDANSDYVLPHGLWGNTVDGDGTARHGDQGHGAQGGGAIESKDGSLTAKGDKHTVKDYEVGGLFDTNFVNFNRFHETFSAAGY